LKLALLHIPEEGGGQQNLKKLIDAPVQNCKFSCHSSTGLANAKKAMGHH
jgi:hypothetical protein